MTHCIPPQVWTKTASKICKLKCKAGLSTTLMKSHIKPSRESMCTGGNESETKPTGSSASYLIPFPLFLHYYYLACHSPRNFLPFLSLIFFFSPLFTIFITFPYSLFPCHPPLFTSPSPPIFLFAISFHLPPSLRLFPPLSICRCHIWQLSAPDYGCLAGRERVR